MALKCFNGENHNLYEIKNSFHINDDRKMNFGKMKRKIKHTIQSKKTNKLMIIKM